METFRIHSTFVKQDFIRGMQIRWEIQWLKNRKQLITLAIISVTILSMGLLVLIVDGEQNPFVFLGIGFTFASLILTYSRKSANRRYSQKIEEIANKFESIGMDCTYEFSDESIKYWDQEKTIDLKWPVFTYYSIYKNYLILILNNSLIESYIFEKKENNMDSYNKILEITKLKLQFKELK